MEGCFLPHEAHVYAGPNSQPFIMRPTENLNTTHPETVAENITDQGIKRSKQMQTYFKNDDKKSEEPSKVLVLEKKGGVSESDKHQQTRTGKKPAYKYVGANMIHKLNINGVCITENDKFATAFCLSMVHTGVNKCISNSTILENYQAGINAMKVYHKFVTTTATPGFEDVTLQLPVEIAVNKNNIHLMEKNIL